MVTGQNLRKRKETMIPIKGKYTNAIFTIDEVEKECLSQVVRMTNHFAFTNPIVLMPDSHKGKGSCIGFTMEMGDFVIPSVVGSDIGCGLLSWKYKMPDNLNLEQLDKDIRAQVPFGTNIRSANDSKHSFELKEGHPIFKFAHQQLTQMWFSLREKFGNNVTAPPEVDFKWWQNKCNELDMNWNRAQYSLGTLGGGNHFCELGKSSRREGWSDYKLEQEVVDYLWITIHSGSRNFGKTVAEFYQDLAVKRYKDTREGDYKEAIEQIKATSPHREIGKRIQALRQEMHMADGIDMKGLETLTRADMYNYLYDMVFAQIYATYNRECMMVTIRDIMKLRDPLEEIETIHNFISPEDLVIRKGAVHAPYNKKIIIPFNMKDGTWICTGIGNSGWNNSAPHGAGRTMSRSQAKRELSQEEAKKQMEGIYTSCIPLDEAPNAYKSASMIKEAIRPTANIIEEVKPIMNMKAK